ncbi:MAG: hypothetical protein ACM3VX_09435, partial [Bacteroidota bacterium]
MNVPPQANQLSSEIDQLTSEAFARVDALTPQIVAARRSFHHYPEVGWTEFCTAARVATALESWDWQVRAGPAVVAADARPGVPDATELEAAWQRAVQLVRTPGTANGWGPQDRLLHWIEVMRGGFTGVVADLQLGSAGDSADG